MGDPVVEEKEITGVAVDSRLVQPGHLFFALEGEKTNGHLFLKEVVQKQGAAAVVHKSYPHTIEGLPLIKVDDVLTTLQTLCKKMMEERKQKIVAITGSIGKTTTKDFTRTLLSQKYQVASTPGNSNSQIGLPLAIFNHTTGKEDVLVLEMGMTLSGEISRLVQMIPPDIAVLTKTALVHAMNFNSLEEIGRAKAEIFSHPKTTIAIFDRYCINYREIKKGKELKTLTFALESKDADYSLVVKQDKVEISSPEGEYTLAVPKIPGKHNLHNYLAAVVTARALSLSWEEIKQGTALLSLPERRLQPIEKNGILFINDSYNASPAAVKAALKSLPAPKPGGKKIAVLGEMLELGKFSRPCHIDVGTFALRHLDYLFCYGQECSHIKRVWDQAGKPATWGMERSEILEELRRTAQEGDVVLLKGSRSKQVWKVLEEL